MEVKTKEDLQNNIDTAQYTVNDIISILKFMALAITNNDCDDKRFKITGYEDVANFLPMVEILHDKIENVNDKLEELNFIVAKI